VQAGLPCFGVSFACADQETASRAIVITVLITLPLGQNAVYQINCTPILDICQVLLFKYTKYALK